MTPPIEHTDVGAYVLGVLDAHEAEAFEAHLLSCEICQAELKSLSSLPDLLDELREQPVAAAEPLGAADPMPRLLDELAVRRRRRRVITWVAAAAATVAIIAGPILTATFTATDPNVVAFPDGVPKLTGSGPTGASLELTVQGRGWGSDVVLALKGVRGPEACELIAVSKTGQEVTVNSWLVPDRGYGVPDSPKPLMMRGGAALKPGDIAKFEVRTLDKKVLVSIPA
ncbi:anti-sigma factor family protein [Crossiella sp. CA198]|uniref:anti-sigma factor family protein n=1 Tax=Crossiella sp. CA198 TaxID=3455607 RepID=UPI003F8D7EB3